MCSFLVCVFVIQPEISMAENADDILENFNSDEIQLKHI